MTSQSTSESEKDMVYLHVIPRQMAGSVVNISPFAIKLELWLRINDIKFKTIDDMSFSKKGQSPFIMFNGEQLPDSNMIVTYLSTYFSKDPFPGLSQVDRAIARSFIKMLEENTAWTIFVYRYIENVEEYAQQFALALPLEDRIKRIEMIKSGVQDFKFLPNDLSILKAFADVKLNVVQTIGIIFMKGQKTRWAKEKMMFSKRAHAHGIGRHTPEEIYEIGCQDIQAVSDFLGDKKFMMGGNQPSLVDCVVFGVLSQVVYVPINYPQRKHIMEKCQNIVRLMDNLKDTYWKSWQEECDM